MARLAGAAAGRGRGGGRMIVVAGEIGIDPADAAKAKAAALEMAAATRGEEGCLRYAFWADLERPGRFHVYEEWESADALAAHFQTPHMARFREALGGLRVLSRDVRKFETGAPEAL